MKLYKKYLAEREDADVAYNDECFVAYKIYDDKTALIRDIYSDSEIRGKGKMLSFMNDFIGKLKQKNIKTIFTCTDTLTKGWERSHNLILKFGFKYIGKDPKNTTVNNYCLNIQEK